MRILTAMGLACAVTMLAIPVGARAANSGSFYGIECQEARLPVKLEEDSLEQYELVGWLCWKGWLYGKTVQVLVSGLSYDHHYWDFPFNPNKYSYVRTSVRNGYATFNIDRIGVGKSAHPDPDTVTVPSQAYVAYQVVQALRQGDIADTSFSKIIGVGHSLGAAVWMIAAADYPLNAGVDGLILTSYLHGTVPETQAALAQARHPAQEDPKFKHANLPDGYFTSIPGTRHLYYNPHFVDPRVLATDEQLKQTATIGELVTIGEAQDPAYTGAITVPTLVVVGQMDSLFCDESAGNMSCSDGRALIMREAPHYNPHVCLDVFVLPISGHDINLHYNAPVWFHKALRWSDRKIGRVHWEPIHTQCNSSFRKG